jgi:hypothetical protein
MKNGQTIPISLKHSAIVLKDQDDELKWSLNKSLGVLTTKLGYKSKINEGLGDVSQWWWKLVWKLACPLKIIILLWISLANKILTWDNGQKRNWIGPGWCCMCKNDCESVDHLFVYCQFTKVVWMEISNSFKLQIH